MAKRIKKILVPVDFSACSNRALAAACDMAELADAELTLLHVFQPPGIAYPDGFVPASPQAYSELIARVDAKLATLRKRASRHAKKVSTRATEAFTTSIEIADEAKRGKFDLVVMGTHGHTGFKHFLLGSVAENVVRHSAVPVMTVRADAK